MSTELVPASGGSPGGAPPSAGGASAWNGGAPDRGGSSAGGALAAELAAIEKTMREERHVYNKDEAMQRRYLELISRRDNLPTPLNPDAWRGTPAEIRKTLLPEVVKAFDEHGQFAHNLRNAQNAIQLALVSVGDEKAAAGIMRSFDMLPATVQAPVLKEFGRGVPAFVKPVSEGFMRALAALPAGEHVMRAWGEKMPRKVANIKARWDRTLAEMSEADRDHLGRWVDRLGPREMAAMLWMLGGGA